ncbi:MAG: RluA family pseudouridine synthase [Planctomycetes bacterium]|nr:RluA family pseudouridine synthase [Planctomycetota bacterium]
MCAARKADAREVDSVGNCHRSLAIGPETPELLRKADRAVQSLAGASRRQTVGLFDHGCVFVNGLPCSAPWQRLGPGDVVELRFDDARRYAPRKKPPKYLGFQILFEDEHLIVVEKPAGWLTVPSPRGESNTLIQRISDYYTRGNRGRRVLVRAVHRLDRGVSGVLVFARHDDALRGLRRQFESHSPSREYWAIVAGVIATPQATIRSYLATSKSLTRYSTSDPDQGELAITHYCVESVGSDYSILRVRLETGRRNQIRVHLAEAGHPVLGDQRYSPERAAHPRWRYARLALHAETLEFTHPCSGEKCRFESPLPAEFTDFQSR